MRFELRIIAAYEIPHRILYAAYTPSSFELVSPAMPEGAAPT
jgi:hypothetical protein